MDLILGTAQIDSSYGITRIPGSPVARWEEVLGVAQSLGFAGLDSASSYAGAHLKIGEIGWTGPIHTKVPDVAEAVRDFRLAKKDLRTSRIELVYFHSPPSDPSHVNEFKNAAQLLLAEGAAAVGASVYEPTEVLDLLEVAEISYFQVPLNLVDRRFAGELTDAAVCKGKKFIARSVFLQGALLSRSILERSSLPRELTIAIHNFHSFCDREGLDPLVLAVKYVSSLDFLSGVVIGVETVTQAKQISGAWTAPTPSLDWNELDRIFEGLPPELADPRRWK